MWEKGRNKRGNGVEKNLHFNKSYPQLTFLKNLSMSMLLLNGNFQHIHNLKHGDSTSLKLLKHLSSQMSHTQM